MSAINVTNNPARSTSRALSIASIALAFGLVAGCTGEITGVGDGSEPETRSDAKGDGGDDATGPREPVELVERELDESSGDIVNPDRGYYIGKNLLKPGDLSGVRADGHSLVIAVVRLDDYRDRALDAAVLTAISDGFAAGRAAGIKYILRFSYNASFTDDAPLAIVLQHIEQLTPHLQANADVISVMQAGFVGAWGEWHGSTNGLESDSARAAILTALLEALPADRFLQVRTPMFKEAAFPGGPTTEDESFTETARARIGHHNDCFLASTSDLGTYANPVQDWMEYVAEDTWNAPMGGETCGVYPPRTNCDTSVGEMEAHHWSYLNSQYNVDVLNVWTADGCGDEVRERLGYRLVAERVRYAEEVRPGSRLPVEIDVANRGFSAPYNARPVYLVLTDGTGTRRVQHLVSSTDIRRWYAETTTTVHAELLVPNDLEPGTYSLSLWMPDQAQNLRGDSRFAVRLANSGVWHGSSGLNTLVDDIAVVEHQPEG
jgi:hypothetical protein